MNFYDDFGDSPSVEERMPFGVSPEEMLEVMEGASLGVCAFCEGKVPLEDLIETDIYEFLTMDIDPLTLTCPGCLEDHRLRCIPDDPSLYDCYTPLECF